MSRTLFAIGLGLVLTQRIGLPVAGTVVPLGTIVMLAFAVVLLITRQGLLSVVRLPALLALATIGMFGAMAALAPPNLQSLALVLATWAPAAVVILLTDSPRDRGELAGAVLEGVIVATAISATLALSQAFFGGFDPVQLIPESFRVQGFNTTYEVIESGTVIAKPNGVFFLEPSFLSLFAVLSAIAVATGSAFASRRPTFRYGLLTVLIAGFVISVATSGLVLLPLLLIALAARARGFLLVGGAAITILLVTVATPTVSAFFARLGAAGSNEARLVRPYTELLPAVASSPWFGHGPGSARDAAEAMGRGLWQLEVTTPTLVKVVYEYGVLGLAAFGVVVFSLLSRAQLSWITRLALVITLMVPTDGLTSGIIAPVFILTSLAAEGSPVRASQTTLRDRSSPRLSR